MSPGVGLPGTRLSDMLMGHLLGKGLFVLDIEMVSVFLHYIVYAKFCSIGFRVSRPVQATAIDIPGLIRQGQGQSVAVPRPLPGWHPMVPRERVFSGFCILVSHK